MQAQPGAADLDADRLQFSDAASFQSWRERLPPANTAPCHAALAAQLRQLLLSELPAATRLELLELLRQLAATVQAEQIKRYRGKPVPLDDDDRAVWARVAAVWSALATGYDSLIETMAGGEPEIAVYAPLIGQRALRYTALEMGEYSRIYRTVPAALWVQLHRLYLFAENAGVATEPVDDAIGRTATAVSCVAIYVHALLLQLAQPDSLSVQQLETIDRWLDRWSALVSLAPEPLPAGAIPPIAVDLASDRGAGFAKDLSSTDVRYLNLEPLSRLLRQSAAALKQGQTPGEFDLAGLTRAPAEKLLMLLYVQWCATGTGRADERSAGGVVVTISPNLASIHYHLTGRAFRQPGEEKEMTARERQDMDVLGITAERTDRILVSQRSAMIEAWVIVNKSASGFLGMCRDPSASTHISHNQLLGLMNPTNKQMYLGTVQRLIVDDAGGIWVGLRLISGTTQGAAVRNAAARGPESVKYERALLVPEDVARKVPASVLLMPGWYAGNRMLDLHVDRPQKIKLLALLDEGPNFERASYTAG